MHNAIHALNLTCRSEPYCMYKISDMDIVPKVNYALKTYVKNVEISKATIALLHTLVHNEECVEKFYYHEVYKNILLNMKAHPHIKSIW